jgi:hypothetical protein
MEFANQSEQKQDLLETLENADVAAKKSLDALVKYRSDLV